MLIKKTDKIVVIPFLKLFGLVLSVTVFIMLMQFFLVYFDELIGKDLGWWIYTQLFFYFGINATPMAFPLATLVASLMVFGNLGEQLELTALKSAGITFLRILRPLLWVVAFLSLFVYVSNGYFVPKVTIKAHTLLYDLRKKKPSVLIKEGVFYNGIPHYSIRVEKKLEDQRTLSGILIYDHTDRKGNVNLTTATTGLLGSVNDGQYLSIELFDGYNYLEYVPKKKEDIKYMEDTNRVIPNFYRTSFKSQKVLLDLDAFKLTRTDENSLTYHHSTKTSHQIQEEIYKMQQKITKKQQIVLESFQKQYPLPVLEAMDISRLSVATGGESALSDTLLMGQGAGVDQLEGAKEQNQEVKPEDSFLQQLATHPNRLQIANKTLTHVKDIQKKIQSRTKKMLNADRKMRDFQVEKYKRNSYALSCILMLFIGASLGALLKKGGFGVPLLISTVFILLYYVLDIFGGRWAKAGFLDALVGSWAPNLILLPLGLFFLRQAQRDTRLLDGDAYRIRYYILNGEMHEKRHYPGKENSGKKQQKNLSKSKEDKLIPT
eukprot:gene188-250_t